MIKTQRAFFISNTVEKMSKHLENKLSKHLENKMFKPRREVVEATSTIGYELLTNFQGQGIMKEAAEKVINYAFQTLRLQKIEAYTHNQNSNSTKLLEQLNFMKAIATDKENADFTIFTLTHSLDNK